MTEKIAELLIQLSLLVFAFVLLCLKEMSIGEFMICMFISHLINRVVEIRDKEK